MGALSVFSSTSRYLFQCVAPDGVVFLISATMLHRQQDYDASLESFCKPFLPLLEYKLDRSGRMTVLNDTFDYHSYVDCTFIVETLFSFVKETIEKNCLQKCYSFNNTSPPVG
jgi:hypothetical protein